METPAVILTFSVILKIYIYIYTKRRLSISIFRFSQEEEQVVPQTCFALFFFFKLYTENFGVPLSKLKLSL